MEALPKSRPPSLPSLRQGRGRAIKSLPPQLSKTERGGRTRQRGGKYEDSGGRIVGDVLESKYVSERWEKRERGGSSGSASNYLNTSANVGTRRERGESSGSTSSLNTSANVGTKRERGGSSGTTSSTTSGTLGIPKGDKNGEGKADKETGTGFNGTVGEVRQVVSRAADCGDMTADLDGKSCPRKHICMIPSHNTTRGSSRSCNDVCGGMTCHIIVLRNEFVVDSVPFFKR